MKLEDIRKLIEAATAGPWPISTCTFEAYEPGSKADDDPGQFSTGKPYLKTVATGPLWNSGVSEADAAFISAARTLMPKLLAVAEAAKARWGEHSGECYPAWVAERRCLCGQAAIDEALDALEAE